MLTMQTIKKPLIDLTDEPCQNDDAIQEAITESQSQTTH